MTHFHLSPLIFPWLVSSRYVTYPEDPSGHQDLTLVWATREIGRESFIRQNIIPYML